MVRTLDGDCPTVHINVDHMGCRRGSQITEDSLTGKSTHKQVMRHCTFFFLQAFTSSYSQKSRSTPKHWHTYTASGIHILLQKWEYNTVLRYEFNPKLFYFCEARFLFNTAIHITYFWLMTFPDR